MVSIFTPRTYAEETQPVIIGSYGVGVDVETGKIFYNKKADTRSYPASVTKVMTALVFLENSTVDEKIVMSNRCIHMVKSNSQINLKAGEVLSRDTALYTMLVISANDVACAIGEHVSGSESKFAKLMTDKAKELGAKRTQFKNASGLHHAGHYTTSRDLAIIGREAIKNPMILDAMGTKTYIVRTNKHKRVKIENTSKMHDDPTFIGGKTGFTDEARNTLMRIDEKNGIRTLTVVLGKNKKVNKYNIQADIKKISNYGMNRIMKEKVVAETLKKAKGSVPVTVPNMTED